MTLLYIGYQNYIIQGKIIKDALQVQSHKILFFHMNGRFP